MIFFVMFRGFCFTKLIQMKEKPSSSNDKETLAYIRKTFFGKECCKFVPDAKQIYPREKLALHYIFLLYTLNLKRVQLSDILRMWGYRRTTCSRGM